MNGLVLGDDRRRRLMRFGAQIQFWMLPEPFHANLGAKVVRHPVMHDRADGVLFFDFHPADRIDMRHEQTCPP